MKMWEKILLYPIGLCYWFADKAKMTGNFIGRKAKPAIAMLVAVTMMLSLMPLTAFAASSSSVRVGDVEMYSDSGATYYVNGATAAVAEEPAVWNAKYESGTLTINNLLVTGSDPTYKYAGNYANIVLTIHVQGANSVTGGDADENYHSYGIYAKENLTITGPGALSANGGDVTGSGKYSVGIYIDYASLTFQSTGILSAIGGDATTDGYSCGIYVSDNSSDIFSVSSGTINATGGNVSGNSRFSSGIYASSAVAVSGDAVINAVGGNSSAGTSMGVYCSKKFIVSGNAVINTIGGMGYHYSTGLKTVGTLSVSDAAVINATGGTATVHQSYGIEYSDEVTMLGGTVVATGGTAPKSYGVYTFYPDYYSLTVSGGVLIARSGNGTTTSVALNKDPVLSGTKVAGGAVDGNAAVIVPDTWADGSSLNFAGGAVTLNNDYYIVNANSDALKLTDSTNIYTNGHTLLAVSLYNGDLLTSGINCTGSSGTVNSDTSNRNLYVRGNGKVIAVGGKTNGRSIPSCGIKAYLSVSDAAASVIAIGGPAKSYSCGIYGDGAIYGSLTAIGGPVADGDSNGIRFQSGDMQTSGTVTAIGGVTGSTDSQSRYGSAGINGKINIQGGTVSAVGSPDTVSGYSCGIRYNNASGTSVSGGVVNAVGGPAKNSYGFSAWAPSITGGTLNAAGGPATDTSYGFGASTSAASKVSGTAVINAVGGVAANSYGIKGGTNIQGGTINAIGISYGLSAESSSLAGGSYTGGKGAVQNSNGSVSALLASGYSYFAGDDHLTPADSDTTVGSAYQTVTVKVSPHTHSYTYATNGNVITESCSCGHNKTATLEIDTTVSTVYTGSAIKALKVTYSSDWAGDKNAEISYSNNTDVGTASGSVTIGGVTATKSFTITKKSAEAPAAPTAQNAVTYGAELSEVGLTAGWAWADGNIIPTVNNSGYTAYYTPADTANVDWTAVDGWNASAERVERTVAVTVNKSTPTYTAPTGLTATYGNTLANVSLPSGWTWKNASATVGNVGVNSFKAVFTPADTDNYDTVEIDVIVTVGKADASYTTPTGLAATYGDTLANVSLPSGWTWKTPSASVGNVGVNSFKAVYTPSDTDNFNSAEVDVSVTVGKANSSYTAPTAKELVYNGSAQTLVNAGSTTTGAMQYALGSATEPTGSWGTALPQGQNAGTYYIWYKVVGDDNHNDVAPAFIAVTIAKKEIDISWGAVDFLPYTGSSLVPQANATNLASGDTCTLTTAVVETAAGAGVIPGTWTAKVTALSNDNYTLPASAERVTATFRIVNGYQDSAPFVSGISETISGKGDGKITGVDSTMEYRMEGQTTYTPVSGTEVTGLHDGVYYVRYAAKTYYNPSSDAQVTVGAGRKLTVTVPQNQIGYTLSVDKAQIEYMDGPTITLIIHDGYSKTESFAVKFNGNDMQWGDFTQLGTQSCTEDVVITVEGIADITAPSAQIDIQNNKWTSFWNGITFGLFFNKTQDVTVTAADTGSGVRSIQYYLASGELELDEVKQIPVWQDCTGTFRIDPDNAYVVYVKITDNAGNVLYLNSDGVVLDETVPTLVGIENGQSYYGDKRFKALDDYLDTLKVDGVDVTDEMNGDNEYRIVADNAEHIVTATDKAGNVTEYQIKVYKNYTVTYKVDGNTVSTQTVGHGKDATAPAIPEKVGYTQTAPVWDKDGTNITADTEINAVYTINKYTVTYKADGNVVGTVTVEHGKDATAPAIAAKEGYTQTAPAWDKDSKNITADTEINAVYTINKYTVTYKADGKVVGTVEVAHGKDATAPAIAAKEGCAAKWDHDGKNITTDTAISVIYTPIPATPATGDTFDLGLWAAVMAVSAAALAVLLLEQKKRKGQTPG